MGFNSGFKGLSIVMPVRLSVSTEQLGSRGTDFYEI